MTQADFDEINILQATYEGAGGGFNCFGLPRFDDA